ncbi:MAG: NAD-binding protein, partial [Corynebacterium matruchotii]
MPAPPSRTDSTLVIGLGRFGSAVAATLDRLGREVLAVEANPAIVRQWTGRIPLVEADATDVEALEQLGATEFGTAVVGVATSLEASVLITGNLNCPCRLGGYARRMIILARYPGSCHRDGAGLGAPQSGGFIGSLARMPAPREMKELTPSAATTALARSSSSPA